MKVGTKFEHERLGPCEIVHVHPLGTIDVKDQSGKHYRVTGLPIKPDVFKTMQGAVDSVPEPISLPYAIIKLCTRYNITQDQAIEVMLRAQRDLEEQCDSDAARLVISTQAVVDRARELLEGRAR